MTTTRKLVDLFRAIGAEDLPGAIDHARQLSDLEEKQGHRGVARQLRGALNGHGSGASTSLVAPSVASFYSTALVRLDATASLADVVLSSKVRRDIEGLLSEWQHSEALKKSGISPRSKILFHGPPGCGKSMTAKAIGRELNLPVFIVRFDALIGAFLGQTAIHLRQLFHFAETRPCVLLLDEIDALGKRRGNPLDVGELDRIVIALLQELEHAKPLGLVIATTNLAKHLDDALWRRFDLDVRFPTPGRAALRQFVQTLTNKLNIKLSSDVVRRAAAAPSFAAAETIVLAEVRRRIVSDL
jgi:AAA+ superfamily predicted ATPase